MAFRKSTQLLGTMEFDVNEAKALREDVKSQITELRSRLIEQQHGSVVEKGFQGLCGQFAGNAMQTALKEALRGCTQDLTPNEDDLIDHPLVDDGVPLDNVEDPNLRLNFDLIDEPLVERVEKEKPKKGVKWKDEVTDEPLTKTDYFDGPDDDKVKKHSQTTKSQVRKLEDSLEDLFVNKFLQSSLSDLVRAKPPRFLTNPEERQELTLKMAGKFDDYLMRHGVSENERKERVNTFIQVFGDTINREGSDEIPGMGKISQCVESARPLQESIVDELGNQIGKLMSKLQYLDDYIKGDPLSEKAIAHDRLVWAQTTVTALDDLIANLTRQLPENTPRENLPREQRRIFDAREAAIARRDQAIGRVEQAQTEFDGASFERPPGIDSDSARRIAYANRRREFVQMKLFLDQIGMRLGRGVDGNRETTGAFLDRMRVKTLETMEQWQPIVRDMNVSRDGVDRLYRSEIVPGSRIGGAVGRSYQEHGVKGLVPGDRVNMQHAPNLQVSYLSRVEKSENGDEVKTGLLKTIRHGVLDVFGIPNEQTRKEASKAGAKEVLTTSVEINDDFKQRALEKHDQGNQPSSKIVHINIGLLPGELSSKQRDRRDGEFIQHQFDAFNELPDENGKVMLPVVNEQNIERNVEFEVDTISFAFGTPKDKDEAKRFEEHDRQSMIKLFGDAMPGTTMGGYMGGLVDRLTRLSRQEDTSPEQKQAITKLLATIRGEVDTVRSEFTSGRYKTSDEDRHRMARHVMRVVDLGAEALRLLGDNDTLMSLSEGCRDNLDSGSMVDVEHKTQAIIEDFGGLVIPGTLSEQDRTIYNTVLTSSGQVEMQTMTTGLGGTGSVDEVSDRSSDPKALEYARGFGSENRL